MRSMLCVLHAMVEQTLCNARLGRKCRSGQGLMIRQRMGRTAHTTQAQLRDVRGISGVPDPDPIPQHPAVTAVAGNDRATGA